jgi:hypothetical protein
MYLRLSLKSLVLVCLLVAVIVASRAAAAPRMLVGFQDDPSYRWRDDRANMLDQAQSLGASILRTTVYWSRIARTRPANPRNPFDPAYRFDDLDEFVRGAEQRGMEVMLTIWGTPGWANGGKGQQYSPTNLADLTAFARAVAARYSGTFAGYPFVRRFTVWNESNLGQFLSPQYNSQGQTVSPAVYARLYRAAYAGIKAGNPLALVGMGETSARGRDHPTTTPGMQQTVSPGRFARLLSLQRPKLAFDAWSQHPYPLTLTQPPLAPTRYPNVTLANLSRFERDLDTWFGRRNIPIWITEYGYQTRPQEPGGVSWSLQALYMRQVLDFIRRDPRVQMFIWFIMRDDPTSTWQSGVMSPLSLPKPAFTVFRTIAREVDARNPIFTVKGGLPNPIIRLPALELLVRNGPGVRIGATVRVYLGTRLVGVSQPAPVIAMDGTVSFLAPFVPAIGRTYTLVAELGDANGNNIVRTASIVAVA